MKRAFTNWQTKLHGKGWNMLYLENHDHPRIVSRYGSEKFRVESAKMLAATYLFMQGTPFIYQGQEIGMTNWRPESPDMYEDVQTIWQYKNVGTRKSPKKRLETLWNGSRDSARTPVQWTSGRHAGFTSAAEPWFYINENYKEINVEADEKNPNSVLNFYRKAIALRKSMPVVKDGKYVEYGKNSKKFYTYSRENEKEKLLVVCSFSDRVESVTYPKGFDVTRAELILSNYGNNAPKTFKPYEVRVYHWKK